MKEESTKRLKAYSMMININGKEYSSPIYENLAKILKPKLDEISKLLGFKLKIIKASF